MATVAAPSSSSAATSVTAASIAASSAATSGTPSVGAGAAVSAGAGAGAGAGVAPEEAAATSAATPVTQSTTGGINEARRRFKITRSVRSVLTYLATRHGSGEVVEHHWLGSRARVWALILAALLVVIGTLANPQAMLMASDRSGAAGSEQAGSGIGQLLRSSVGAVGSGLLWSKRAMTPASTSTFVVRSGMVFGGVILVYAVMKRARLSELTPFSVPTETHTRIGRASRKARLQACVLRELVDSLVAERARWGSLIVRLRSGHRAGRREIYDILSQASDHDLNSILLLINVARLMHVASRETMDMLCSPSLRLEALETVVRAVVLDALQKVGDERHHFGRIQAWIRNVLTATKREDLTYLKNLIDDGGDYHNLAKLVYRDLTNKAYRNQVLQHMRTQAHAVLDTDGDGHISPSEFDQARCKILSDVDDTLCSSGGRFPAGVDARFPHHTVYPGVLALFRELDLGPRLGALANRYTVTVRAPGGHYVQMGVDDSDTIADVRAAVQSATGMPAAQQTMVMQRSNVKHQLCNLVFLSARPHAYKDLAEASSYEMFRQLRDEGRMHTMPTLLPGTLSTGAKAVVGLLSDYVLERMRNVTVNTPTGRRLSRLLHSRSPDKASKRGARRAATKLPAVNEFKPARRDSIELTLPPRAQASAATQPDASASSPSSSPAKASPAPAPAPAAAASSSQHAPYREASYKEKLRRAARRALRGEWTPPEGTTVRWKPVGEQKFASYRRFCDMYPEYKMVFIGDNGQGDVRAGELMMADKAKQCQAVIIHQVRPLHETDTTMSNLQLAERIARWKKANIVFVRTYLGAAVAAYCMGLIHISGLVRVARASVKDLEDILLASPMVESTLHTLIVDLNTDIEAANEYIPHHQRLPKLSSDSFMLSDDNVEEEDEGGAGAGAGAGAGGAGGGTKARVATGKFGRRRRRGGATRRKRRQQQQQQQQQGTTQPADSATKPS